MYKTETLSPGENPRDAWLTAGVDGIYTLRFSGHSELGSFIRQYEDISVDYDSMEICVDSSVGLVQPLFEEGDPGLVGDGQFISGTSYSIGFLRSATRFNPNPQPFLPSSVETITLTVYAKAPVFGLESYIFFGLRGDQCDYVLRTIDRRVTVLGFSEPEEVPGIFGEIDASELLAEFSSQGCSGTISDLYIRQVQVSAFFGGEKQLDAFAIGEGPLRILEYSP